MKYLMSALIISEALAIAVPAWAQTPMTPPQTKAVTESGRRATTHHHVGPSRSQNNLADQLNADELATLRAGSPIYRMPSGGKQLTSDR
jgi:hypothetical protein